MGKGSKRRPMKITSEQYAENYDKIFGKKEDESYKELKKENDEQSTNTDN